DEVNGRRFQVRKYLDEGKPLECRDIERCQYCFIESFCTSADRVIARQNQATWDVWWIGTPEGATATAALDRATLPFGARHVGLEVDDLTDLEHLPVAEDIGIYVRPQRITRVVERDVVTNQLIVVAREAAHLDVLLADATVPDGVRVEIELNVSTAPWLLAHRERVAALLDRLHLRQPSYEFMKDAVANDVRHPQAFFEQLALPISVSGLPACMTPGAQLAEGLAVLRQKMFDPETGRVAIRELARTHVVDGYFGKSLRCRDCRVVDRCEGAHINFIRDQGFKEMEPLREGAWADAAEAQLLALYPEKPSRLRDGRPLEPVAPSLPGYAPAQPAPEEPLIEFGRKAREAKERRRLEFEAAQPVPEN
ncbi:MAG: hypothetical protein U1E76_28980, partial [Planctomycetota bacterium]